MRAGCGGRLTDSDGWPGGYSYLNIDTSPDRSAPTTLSP
jgi:hypothetical protein